MTELTRTDTVLDPATVVAELEQQNADLETLADHYEALTTTVSQLVKAVEALTTIVAAATPKPRPVGDFDVRFEDLGVATVREALAKMPAGQVLNLPEGTFEFTDFLPAAAGQPYTAGLTVPTTCLGIVGQGVGKTVLRMKPRTSSRAASVPAQSKAPATNPLYLIQAAGGSNQVFQGFTLEGTEQGHLYGGLALASAINPAVRDILITGIPGDRNSPPGETFAINVWRGTGMWGQRIEVDGRRGGVRIGGSPFGYNTTSGSVLMDCYFHHCLASTLTYWETTNCRTERVRCEYNGTGPTAGMQYAHGINHERSADITHVDPRIILDRTTNLSGYHMSWNSDTIAGTLTVRNPSFDPDTRDPRGRLIIMSLATYRGAPQKQTVKPVVLDAAGKALDFAWAH